MLQKGSKGIEVIELQNQLIAKGYPLPNYGADGDFGSETERALIAFQQANSLNPTGILDTSTKNKLFDISPVGPLSSSLSTASKSPASVGGSNKVMDFLGNNQKSIGIGILCAIGIAFLAKRKKRRA